MPLSLDKADTIIQGARKKASEMGVNVAIVVVDSGGHPVALARMDGTGFATVEIAQGKAFTAAAFRTETAQFAQRVGQLPFFPSGPEVAGGRLVILGGGLPVREGNDVIGGVGVGGATAEQDADCAKAGLTAAGFP